MIRHLIRLMHRHDLTEIYLQEGDEHIRLRRGTRAAPEPAYLPAGAPLAPAAPAAKPEPAPAAPKKNLVEIKSPTIGTFYSQKEPGSPPYVTVGSRVQPDTTVCL